MQKNNPDKLTLARVLKDLKNDGLIDQKQFNRLLGESEENKRKGIHPLSAIAAMKWQSANQPSFPLSIERLTRWLAERAKLPYLHIDPLKTDFSRLTPLVTHAYAVRWQILPVALKDNTLTIATGEPFVDDWRADLAHILKKDIQRVVANPVDIERYLDEFYKLQTSIKGAGEKDRQVLGASQNFEQLLEIGKGKTEMDAGDQHIIQIVDWLLQNAFNQRASDIHLEPRRESSKIRFRIDGKLHLIHEVPTAVILAMISRIKSLGRMNLAERRKPQDGRIKTVVPDTGKNIELRLSTMPTAFGEKMVMRIFDPEVLVKDFKALGFTKRDLGMWENMITRPHGVVLVTGPTGSGKTSTLYSTLRYVHKPDINICTIEDPIEIVDDRFNQMQVQHNIGVDFASGVRTLLRQDPDIIMVGEIRDQETAEISMQAALTGHLVFSTLHTNDAASAMTRLLNIGLPSYLLNATILGVVAQRLVRTLCSTCKKAVPIDEQLWQSLTAPRKLPMPKHVYEPVGCDDCRQTGYMGRIGLYEIMPLTHTLEKFITDTTDLQALRTQALKEGLSPLRLSGAVKIAAGVTTFEEVFRVAGGSA